MNNIELVIVLVPGRPTDWSVPLWRVPGKFRNKMDSFGRSKLHKRDCNSWRKWGTVGNS